MIEHTSKHPLKQLNQNLSAYEKLTDDEKSGFIEDLIDYLKKGHGNVFYDLNQIYNTLLSKLDLKQDDKKALSLSFSKDNPASIALSKNYATVQILVLKMLMGYFLNLKDSAPITSADIFESLFDISDIQLFPEEQKKIIAILSWVAKTLLLKISENDKISFITPLIDLLNNKEKKKNDISTYTKVEGALQKIGISLFSLPEEAYPDLIQLISDTLNSSNPEDYNQTLLFLKQLQSVPNEWLEKLISSICSTFLSEKETIQKIKLSAIAALLEKNPPNNLNVPVATAKNLIYGEHPVQNFKIGLEVIAILIPALSLDDIFNHFMDGIGLALLRDNKTFQAPIHCVMLALTRKFDKKTNKEQQEAFFKKIIASLNDKNPLIREQSLELTQKVFDDFPEEMQKTFIKNILSPIGVPDGESTPNNENIRKAATETMMALIFKTSQKSLQTVSIQETILETIFKLISESQDDKTSDLVMHLICALLSSPVSDIRKTGLDMIKKLSGDCLYILPLLDIGHVFDTADIPDSPLPFYFKCTPEKKACHQALIYNTFTLTKNRESEEALYEAMNILYPEGLSFSEYLFRKKIDLYQRMRKKNTKEFDSFFARFFPDRSRTNKLAAAKIILDQIKEKTFDEDKLPSAAKNGELFSLIKAHLKPKAKK